MCTGYAKDRSAWSCQEVQDQREAAMLAWSQAFENPDTEAELIKEFILPPALGQTQLAIGFQAKNTIVLPRSVCAT